MKVLAFISVFCFSTLLGLFLGETFTENKAGKPACESSLPRDRDCILIAIPEPIIGDIR